ncbi:unnamed protein product [Phytomonas sp. Hart1]|nr:unnamed protein product [Phytomonas sp. Hart1]|eukprot:CCW68230.1 unnamed protein product [Phytomonas sp. isolate Hart1]
MDPIARHVGIPHPYGVEEADRQPDRTFSTAEDDAGILLHPSAKRLFDYAPALCRIPIFGEACAAYGPACVISLALSYLLCKGIAFNIFTFSLYPMFQIRFGIDAALYQRLLAVMKIAWAMKASTAMLSDTFAFFGYTKRWYMFASCVVGGVFALLYGLLPANPSSGNIAAGFVFLSSYGVATVDILSEGYYSRLMRKIPESGPALVSWVWWIVTMGGFLASILQGPLSDLKMPEVGVFIAAGLQFLASLIYFFNLYGEKMNREERIEDARIMHKELLLELEKGKALYSKEGREGSLDVDQGKALQLLEVSPEFLLPQPIICCRGLIEINKEVVIRNNRIVVYSSIITTAAIIMAFGNLFAGKLGLLIICVVVSLVCSVMSFWALPLIIAKANVMVYFSMMLYIQLPGLLDSFYLAKENCLPDGPHFSNTFYNTIAVGIIGNLAGLVGITAFRYIFLRWRYRLCLVVTTLLWVSASVFDIIMLKRWNVKIGIPDHAMYVCGDAIIGHMCHMVAIMPVMVLVSRLCPRGSESTVYALLAGFANLGAVTSISIGAILMEYVWPIKSVPPCDFKNGPWLVIVGHILLPLLIIPLTLLLPNVRVCDDIDIDGNVISKTTQEESHVKPAKDINEVH